MKKILVCLILVLSSLTYSEMWYLDVEERYDYVPTYSSDIKIANEIMEWKDKNNLSPFYPEEMNVVVSRKRFIAEYCSLYVMDYGYEWDKNEIKKHNINGEHFYNTIKFKPIDEIDILWVIPDAQMMGLVNMISGDISFYGIKEGLNGETQLYAMYQLAMGYQFIMENNKKNRKIALEVNGIKDYFIKYGYQGY